MAKEGRRGEGRGEGEENIVFLPRTTLPSIKTRHGTRQHLHPSRGLPFRKKLRA